MEKPKKGLIVAVSVVVGFVILLVSFLLGMGVGVAVGGETCAECKPVITEKKVEVPVEKIVYKDSEETLEKINSCMKETKALEEDLNIYKTATSLLSEGYITMFDIAEATANYTGQPIHQDWYDLYTVAKGFL